MRTDRQKQASRLNGARSNGPQTPQGKARSSQNALKHGLTAQILVLDCEQPAEFDALLAEHVALFRPRNRVELTLVERMVACLWRSRRGLSIETNRLNLFLSSQRRLNDKNLSQAQLLSRAYGEATSSPGAVPSVERHVLRLDREYDRALQLLLKLQQCPTLDPPAVAAQNEPDASQVPENQLLGIGRQARVLPFPAPPPSPRPAARTDSPLARPESVPDPPKRPAA